MERFSNKQDLIDYLVSEECDTEENLKQMDSRELLDTYLVWEGIIGFTDDIISAVKVCSII